MEDPRWLRLITIGLILSALAVGYFLLTGRFTSTKTTRPAATIQPSPQMQIVQPSPAASPAGSSNGSGRSSAPAANGQRPSGSNISNLPNTGFPLALIGVFSASAIIAGFGLRKYPN